MLPDRKQMILKAIIENYIDSAEPVGSKALMASFDKPLSSATIRNEMSELEEMGLLEKQHVSSGRIPSSLAYRLYVDELMGQYRMAALELENMRREMERKMSEMDSMLLTASRIVSKLTNHTAIAVSGKSMGEEVRKVELIPMDQLGTQYALVLICENSVRNKILRLRSPVMPENISVLTGFVNMAIAEGRLGRLQTLIDQSFGLGSPFSDVAAQIISFIEENRGERAGTEMYLEGASRLLMNREYQDARKAGELLEHMADPQSVHNLLRDVMPGCINIRIGPENGDPALREASFVFTTYEFERGNRGIIGVIAPTRMDYSKASAQLAAFVSTLNDIQGNNLKSIGERNEP